ncbi:MAG: META domain-containing protein [Devosia sp.]
MRFPIAVVCIAVIFTAPAFAAKIDLPGQVTYRERLALPASATLEIQLIDQTLPSLPPRIDVRAPIGPGQVPLSFTLNFDDSLILPGHSYALIAAISVESGLLFRNFEPYAVDPLAPVTQVLIVTNLVGRIEDKTTMSSEPAAPDTPAILDSVWAATSIKDAAILPRTKPSLTIGADMRAGGSGGCNSWFAPAEITGESLRLGSITSTMKACTQSVNLQEEAFKDALAAVATWKVDGDALTLFGTDGKALLSFER